MSRDECAAAQDRDVAVVRERLGYIEDKIVRAAVEGALGRIEQRLARLIQQRDSCKRWHDD